jgi:hypothetical protein
LYAGYGWLSGGVLMVTRKPLSQMTPAQVRVWLSTTREHLRRKMQRERAYLDRRAARQVHTPTDEAYEVDQLLEADLLALLDEIEQGLIEGGML